MSHPHQSILVALAGQPNCGKSTVFNMLTGARQHVANFPGVTVEKKQGVYRSGDTRVELVDLPGTYSLSSHTQEERVARDFILLERPETLVAVVDASNLERHLHLVFQLREMGMPMVLCLNMCDVAETRGIKIDIESLAEDLGMPVVKTVANRDQGAEELKEAVLQVAIQANHDPGEWRVDYGEGLEPVLGELEARLARHHHLAEDFSVRWLAVKILEGDPEARRIALHHTHDGTAGDLGTWIEKRLQDLRGGNPQFLSRAVVAARRRFAARIGDRCLTRTAGGATWSDRVDAIACSPLAGVIPLGLLVYLTFYLTFELADGWQWVPWFDGWTTPVGVLGWLFDDFLLSLLDGMREGPLRSLLGDGVIGGVGGVIGFTPFIFFMFIFLSILEESGIVARIAFITDRFLRIFGLPGSSVLPLIISGGITGGCAVPGVLATRTLHDERDRLVTMLVVPFMNCGAKIPVYLMLIGAFFQGGRARIMLLLMAISWITALVAAAILRRTVVPGEQTPFLLELPPYRLPTLRSVFQTAFHRSWLYVKKAGTIILLVSVIIWGLMYLPRADRSEFDQEQDALRTRLTTEASESLPASLLGTDELEMTERFLDAYRHASKEEEAAALELLRVRDPDRFAFAVVLAEGEAKREQASPALRQAVEMYERYQEGVKESESNWREVQLRQSFAGRIGRSLAPVSRIAGFDWRDNIALIGGVAAKEVVVSTLGTAYALSDEDVLGEEDEASNPLAERLRSDPEWSPRRALAMMLFVMLYAPCIPTVAVLWSESGSWKWASFSIFYSTAIAFVVATLVFQLGAVFGLGG